MDIAQRGHARARLPHRRGEPRGAVRPAALVAHLQAPPARRPLLAARFAEPALRPAAHPRSCSSAAGSTATATASRACCSTSKAPVKAIVGPWNHDHPDSSEPGPAHRLAARGDPLVGPLAEGPAQRGGGGAEAGRLRAGTGIRPIPTLREIPGEWRLEEGWPPRRAAEQTLHLQADRSLGAGPSAARRAPAALRAFRGRGGGLLVGRAAARPAAGRRAQPRLRHGAARRRRSRSSACRASRCAPPRTRRSRTGSCGSPTSPPTARSRW